MRISDWSSDVCSSDLLGRVHSRRAKLAHDHSRPHRFKARIVHNNTFWPRPLTRNAPCGAEQPPATSAPALSSKLAVDQRLARSHGLATDHLIPQVRCSVLSTQRPSHKLFLFKHPTF